MIVLFRPDGGNVYQNDKELELSCENFEEFKLLKTSFEIALNSGKSVSFHNLFQSIIDT